MKKVLLLISFVALRSSGFCGFYLAKADAGLYNRASQVVLVRNGDKTAITLFADYKGEPSDFALVVPVPAVLKKEQINVGDRELLDRIDSYSAPRLVEYSDADPCLPQPSFMRMKSFGSTGPQLQKVSAKKAYGVTVEAKYTVGEYDIVILGAKESQGLESWLTDNGYKMPKGVSKALEPYIKQDLKFFVAKVNLNELAQKESSKGYSFLRPIQFAYESARFMLPIRLGMVNADGPQDLIIYAISPRGRVESTNYRTVSLPTGQNVPSFIKDEFSDFYRAMFKSTWEKEDKKVLFQEYGWNMGWCDPCAADPLTKDELRKLGVFWLDGDSPGPDPSLPRRGGIHIQKFQVRPGGFRTGTISAYVTRLHLRYDREHFPEDLAFQETADTTNFQGRYVINHPWTGPISCESAETYRADLKRRLNDEVDNLARLTQWPVAEIKKKMETAVTSSEGAPWYKDIFK